MPKERHPTHCTFSGVDQRSNNAVCDPGLESKTVRRTVASMTAQIEDPTGINRISVIVDYVFKALSPDTDMIGITGVLHSWIHPAGHTSHDCEQKNRDHAFARGYWLVHLVRYV